MTLGRTLTGVSCTALLLAAGGAEAQSFTNGGLTDATATSTVPAGWSPWSGTPDTADGAGPFNYTGTPWTLSPDGGTFVRAGAGSTLEALSQTVSGFSVGQTYTVDFWMSNLGFENPTSGAWGGFDGYWELIVDGTPAATSAVLSREALATDPITWHAESLSFVATATTLELAFRARTTGTIADAAYMGIDGLFLRPIPAPGAAGLLAIGVLGVRRRRS